MECAKADHTMAMDEVASIYFQSENYKEAEKWYLRAIKNGSAVSRLNYGYFLRATRGDIDAAITHYNEAIRNGVTSAIHLLSMAHLEK